ncbi:MAG: HAMP domain-containing histidine kinase [Candidatus Aminicenantes bacterium]|nr:HAMP domain-containing histidine kinase [Candidatus Aminicenantes bacterium]
MKARRFWGLITQKTTVLFLAAAVMSVFALIWMGLRLVQQDRTLEVQQIEEKREAAADRIIAALEQTLTIEERKLDDPQASEFSPEQEDFFLVSMDSEGVRVWPEKTLLYYPVMPSGHEAPSQLFTDAERAEFQDNDYNRAISLLRPLSGSEDPSTRAAAMLRMARNMRKAGRLDAALETYGEIKNFDIKSNVTSSGVPVDLVARRAFCSLLEEMGADPDRLKEEAESLYEDLDNCRWRLDRASYIYYTDLTKEWLGREPDSDFGPNALADAIVWLWENRESVGNMEQGITGRQSLSFYDRAITVLWQKSKDEIAAAVAGPLYQKSQWLDPLFKRDVFNSVSVSLFDSDGTLIYGKKQPADIPSMFRAALVSGLPWDIRLVNANLEADQSQFAQRRRLMMAGLGILALLVIAVSYLISRAVSRELAAARLQADFVSAVSHEFRTPLTSMRQFTEMLNEDDNLPAEKRRTFYQAQARATSRLSRLVESLLDFGRMEAGARPYRLEPLDVGRLVKTVVEEFLQETGSVHSEIECVVPIESTQVKGDGDALAQALWNLLDNAVKYSGENKKIQVEVEEGDPVIIRVRDQGFGIPSSERSRILRKFVRGSNANAQGIKGTGIGLAVVKHIVDAHGGRILIESEPGQGSTFTIQLPAGG